MALSPGGTKPWIGLGFIRGCGFFDGGCCLGLLDGGQRGRTADGMIEYVGYHAILSGLEARVAFGPIFY